MTNSNEIKNGFIVMLVLGFGSLQPVFREDEELMFFDTKEAAQAEIDDCLQSVKEAVEKGDMSDEYEQDDYCIYPATLIGTIICTTIDGIHHCMDITDEDFPNN